MIASKITLMWLISWKNTDLQQTFEVLVWARIIFRVINNIILSEFPPCAARRTRMHYKSLHCESICENHQSFQSPGAVDFSYVTYFQMLLIFWHIKDVQKGVISEEHHQRDAALIPPVAMETAHYREAGMCCRGAGRHGDRYGDLHKWSERLWILMINSARVAPARMGLKQCQWEQRMRTFVCRPRFHQPRSG